jgi:DNA replication protein DnaC
MSLYTQVLNNLKELKLTNISETLSEYLDEKNEEKISTLEILKELTDKELINKRNKAASMNIQMANFPFHKTINDFDFDFQENINKKQILDLVTLRFIDNKQNILFIGNPGVGKTHLACAIGIEASKVRLSTYFINCHDLISNLKKAHYENRLTEKLKHYAKYKVLIIDEIGYLPVDKEGANMFFQLIAKRYEKNPTIITTNQIFSKWGEVFSDNTIATAILDRLVHHSHIIHINGSSYRVKDSLDIVKN